MLIVANYFIAIFKLLCYNIGMKKFEDLTICDDYMFYHVMQNEVLCKTLLHSILSDSIAEITDIAVQKSFETSTNAKGIRLDVWVIDSKGKQYNIEMQTTNKPDIAKRMRYYQATIDSHLMEKGYHYSQLAESFIIFICPFDYLKQGLPIYTFKSLCVEDGKTKLEDGTTKILLNSSASEKVENNDLKAFFEYMNGKESNNEFIKSLKIQINTFKHNNKLREEYMYRMTVEDEIRYETEYQTNIKNAKNMKQKNCDNEFIAEITGLSIEEIEKL